MKNPLHSANCAGAYQTALENVVEKRNQSQKEFDYDQATVRKRSQTLKRAPIVVLHSAYRPFSFAGCLPLKVIDVLHE